jgi:hypothetical protein
MLYVLLCAPLLAAQQNGSPASPQENFRIAGTAVSASTGQFLGEAQITIVNVHRPGIVQNFTTAADGHFHFEGLQAGKYFLTAQRRGFSQQSYQEHFQFSTAIAVGPGKNSENILFRLRPDASLTGTITDEAGEPVRTGTVMLFRQGNENGNEQVSRANEVTTDDQGHYLFGHLRPGTYFVVVVAQPWYAVPTQVRYRSVKRADGGMSMVPEMPDDNSRSPLDVAYPITYYPGVTDPAQSTPITVKTGERADADVALSAEPAVHLRIATGGSGAPGIGASLSQTVFGQFPVPVPGASFSVQAGETQVSGAAPGNYTLTMNSYGKDSHTWSREVNLSENTTVASSGANAAVISGVVAVDGQPPPSNALVQLVDRTAYSVMSAQVSAKGEFHIDAPAGTHGDYQVYVGNVPRAVVTGLLASGATAGPSTVNLRPGANVQLAISMSSALGQVDGVAEFDGKPQGGAMIVLVPANPDANIALFRRDQSDSDGTFTLFSVVPGKYTLLALADGWDLEWNKASVLKPYMDFGQTLEISPRGKYQVKLKVQ